MYDVIVCGARCAGAPTAMLLARKGYEVLLLDRASFPSGRPHGHLIHRDGPRRLAAWGLLDRVTATNCPPITTMTTDYGDHPLTGVGLERNGVALAYAPRRWALEQVLVEAAVEAGAELRTRFRVLEYIREGGRITGIRGGGDDRRGVTEHAIMTVGADGRRSLLACTVNAPLYHATPPLTCWYFSYWSGLGDRGLEVYLRDRTVIIAFPASDGLTGIFVTWPAAELVRVRRDIEASFLAALDEVPELGERVRAGRREERFLRATDPPNFFRTPFGPGWALVGDAGFHQDPYLTLGLADAFRDAELLAGAIDEGLSGRRPIEEAMAGYEQARNQSARTDYCLNLEPARFAPLPPDLMRIRAAIRGDQEATNQYFLAMHGLIPREQFFNPENLARLASRADAALGIPARS